MISKQQAQEICDIPEQKDHLIPSVISERIFYSKVKKWRFYIVQREYYISDENVVKRAKAAVEIEIEKKGHLIFQ